ncbi:hypothetical protein RJG79_08615 [Mycoplasmatota bacterium WC44]
MIGEVAASENADVELWVNVTNNDYELFIMVSGDIQVLALGFYDIK